MSLIPLLKARIDRVDGVRLGLNYGFNKVRFTGTVAAGSRVRLRETLLHAQQRGEGTQLTYHFLLEVQGQERPACSAEMIIILYP